MHTGFKSRCVPTYHLLSAEQIKKIHHATLELLESVGVRVLLPAAVHMLRAISYYLIQPIGPGGHAS
jgi:trimethylamine--corrinoid protein Co-methyltransferase